MATKIILPDVDNIILAYLPMIAFLNMRQVNHHLNDIICNTKLNCKHIIRLKPKTIECTKYLGHIVNVYYDYSAIYHYNEIHNNAVAIYSNKYSNITNERLKYLTNITSLCLQDCSNITNEGILSLTNITSLGIYFNRNINDDALKYLTAITSLQLDYSAITDKGVQHLTNITSLSLGECQITDNGIKELTNMTSLALYPPSLVTGSGLQCLTNLTKLSLNYTEISNEGISRLTKLRELSISSKIITEDALVNLTNLMVIRLRYGTPVLSDRVKSLLPNVKIIKD